jgi:hypothetical protein
MARKTGRHGQIHAKRYHDFKWLTDLPKADKKRAIKLIIEQWEATPSLETYEVSLKCRDGSYVTTVGRIDQSRRLICPKNEKVVRSLGRQRQPKRIQLDWAAAT